MKKHKRLMISLLCALICALCFYLQARHIHAEYDRARNELMARFGSDVVDVVVAKTPLEIGDVVDRKNCEIVSWIAPLVPKGAISKLEDIEGSVVQNPFPEGAPVTELAFRKRDEQVEVPSGYVALRLNNIDKLGVYSSVQPGSSLAAYEVRDSRARLITHNLRVLSCSEKQKTCLLAVLPNEVPNILEIMDRGSLRVVMPAADVEVLPENNSLRAPQAVSAEVHDE